MTLPSPSLGVKSKKAPKKSFELYFVTHGETEATLKGLYAGKSDFMLTTVGREEAIAEGRRLKLLGHQFDVIVSSPLQRALETASLMAQAIGYSPDAIALEPGATERGGGKADGFSESDFLSLDEAHQLALGAESITALRARADAVYELLQERYEGKKVLLVSHPNFGKMLQAVIEGQGFETALTRRDPPMAITMRLV